MAELRSEKIGTVQAQEVNSEFDRLMEACKKDGEVQLIKLGNGLKFILTAKDNALCEDGRVIVTVTMVDDRYTRSLYID